MSLSAWTPVSQASMEQIYEGTYQNFNLGMPLLNLFQGTYWAYNPKAKGRLSLIVSMI